jgi:hypothetical protein
MRNKTGKSAPALEFSAHFCGLEIARTSRCSYLQNCRQKEIAPVAWAKRSPEMRLRILVSAHFSHVVSIEESQWAPIPGQQIVEAAGGVPVVHTFQR